MPHHTFSIPTRQQLLLLIIATTTTLFYTACTKKTKKASDTPSITFIGLSIDSVQAGSNETIQMTFAFKDGDGDLGNAPSSGNYDIYTIDKRDTASLNYYFPQDMASIIIPSQGASGQCTIELNAAFMLLGPNNLTRDTLQYEFYIKDKSGKESNRLTTPDIYLNL